MQPKRINAEGGDLILADLGVPKSFMSSEAPCFCDALNNVLISNEINNEQLLIIFQKVRNSDN